MIGRLNQDVCCIPVSVTALYCMVKSGATLTTVREDDPLLLAGGKELYLPKDSLSDLRRIGEGTNIVISITVNRCIYIIVLGQFGVVFKALLRNDDGRVVEVAIKTIRRYDSQKEMDNFVREMTVMSRLIHPNIIHLYGIVKED